VLGLCLIFAVVWVKIKAVVVLSPRRGDCPICSTEPPGLGRATAFVFRGEPPGSE
jgi:hypothetical protein